MPSTLPPNLLIRDVLADRPKQEWVGVNGGTENPCPVQAAGNALIDLDRANDGTRGHPAAFMSARVAIAWLDNGRPTGSPISAEISAAR